MITYENADAHSDLEQKEVHKKNTFLTKYKWHFMLFSTFAFDKRDRMYDLQV